MALIIFKYFLPILLGYTLFVGLTSRYVPFMRPKSLAKRPIWFFGLWAGVAVAVIMSFGLQLAYRMDLNDVDSLLKPGAWLLAGAMLPGIIGYFWYRSKVTRQLAADGDTRMAGNIEQADSIDFEDTVAHEFRADIEMDDTLLVENEKIMGIDDQTTIWNDMNEAEDLAANFDETQLFDIEPVQAEEPVLFTDQTVVDEAMINAFMDDEVSVDDTMPEESFVETIVESFDAEEPVVEQTSASAGKSESEILARVTAEQTAAMLEVNELRKNLDAELKARCELETHLRITRKGLGELESESRDFESKKAEALMELEQELEERVKRTAAAEARADREASKRAALENEIVLVRQDALKATNESRVSVEARAKALSTASKATTFARQAMEIRTRLETELHNAEAELDSKQNTISSLIKALEKEKARTQEDVASMAKQLRLHEKQLQARRTLEEVSRSVDNKLSTRLVKKVAKARG